MSHVNKQQKTAIAASAAVVAVTATLYLLSSSSDTDDSVTGHKTEAITRVVEPTAAVPSPDATGPLMYGLDDRARWDGGLSLTLGEIERGRTSDIGVPEDTDYIRLALTMTNSSKVAFDLGDLAVACTTEEVYDGAHGLEGTPSTHVLPGKSHTWDIACAQDEDKKYLQVEVEPGREGDRTAIFSGNVE